MSCPREAELLEHFAGTASEPEAIRIAAHVAECERCRAVRAELQAMTARLAPDPGEFDDAELARDVGTLIKLNKTAPQPRLRWPYAAGPMLALAAALALFFLKSPEFQSRSAASMESDRWVSIDLFRVREGQASYQRVDAGIRPDDALLFTLHNGPESPYRHAMVLALDDRGEIFWYHPAYLDPADNPSSIASPASSKPMTLETAVRHRLQPGWLRVIALFSRAPLDVKSVEAIAARAFATNGGVKHLERLPLPDSGQHTLLLRVEPR